MKEDTSSTIVVVRTQGEAFYFVGKDENNPENQSLYEIVTISQRLIPSTKVQSISRKSSQVRIKLKYVPQ